VITLDADATTLARLSDRTDEWITAAHLGYLDQLIAHRATEPGHGWLLTERNLARCVRLLWLELVRRGLVQDFS
jgi:hypothetical protein